MRCETYSEEEIQVLMLELSHWFKMKLVPPHLAYIAMSKALEVMDEIMDSKKLDS